MYISSAVNMLFNYPSQQCCKWALRGGSKPCYHLFFMNIYCGTSGFIVSSSAEPSLVLVRLKSRFMLALNHIWWPIKGSGVERSRTWSSPLAYDVRSGAPYTWAGVHILTLPVRSLQQCVPFLLHTPMHFIHYAAVIFEQLESSVKHKQKLSEAHPQRPSSRSISAPEAPWCLCSLPEWDPVCWGECFVL